MAFGTLSADVFDPMKADGIELAGRLEVGGGLHDLVIGPTEARSLISGS